MGLFDSDLERIVNSMVKEIRNVRINPRTTVVMNLDTTNGYFKNGEISSVRLKEIIPEIVGVNEYFLKSMKLFLLDEHDSNSLEFKHFPLHCATTDEKIVINELHTFLGDYSSKVIFKNSVNPFSCDEFNKWFQENHPSFVNYVIVGGFTDIGVMQLALSLRSYFNEKNIEKKHIIVVENAVQTFDSGSHNGDKMHVFALYNMLLNGINLVKI